jgi:phage terminase Nu1 subunit (DNA packaging protein)
MSNELKRKQFADQQGWRPSYVTKLSKQGRLVLTEDGQRVKVAETLALVEATKGGRNDVAERHADSRELPPQEQAEAAPTASAENIVSELLHALTSPHVDKVIKAVPTAANLVKGISDARRSAALADQEEMNRDRQAKSQIDYEDMRFVIADMGATLHSHLSNLPDQLTPAVYGRSMDETYAAIAQVVPQIESAVADAMFRRIKELRDADV